MTSTPIVPEKVYVNLDEHEPEPLDIIASRSHNLAGFKKAKTPDDEQVDGDGQHDDPETAPGSSWRPVDLAAALDAPPVEPTALRRTDGLGLLYPGRVHWFQGEPESGKSMLGHHQAAETIKAGGRVLLIDYDSDERDVAPRLFAMGCSREQVVEHLDYVKPTEPVTDPKGRVTAGAVALAELLGRHGGAYELVMIDGVTDALAVENIELNDNVGVSDWVVALAKRCAIATNAPVIVVDHVTKSTENRGRFAIGAQSKLAKLDGAAYSIVATTSPGRASGPDPVVGQLRIRLEKDRAGYLRGRFRETRPVVALANVTGWPDGGLSVELVAPGDDQIIDDLKVQLRILEHLAMYDASSGRRIEQGVEGKCADIRAQTKRLVERGWVTVTKSGQAHLHSLTEAGKAELSK